MDNQTLRPSQDFQVGDKVTCEGQVGFVITTNREIRFNSVFPIRVDWNDEDYDYFTVDGRMHVGGNIVLFRLEESDKQPESSMEDRYNTFLKTLQDTLDVKIGLRSFINSEKVKPGILDDYKAMELDKLYKETQAQIILLLSLIEQYQCLEEGI